MLSDVIDTLGRFLIQFSPKRGKLLENLKQGKLKRVNKSPQIKSQKFLPQDGQ